MNGMDKRVIICVGIIGTALSIILGTIFVCNTLQWKYLVENGYYQQRTDNGVVIWVRPEPSKTLEK